MKNASLEKAIIISGSYVNDPALLSKLDMQYAEWKFCPLRMSAWMEAQKCLSADKIVLIEDVVSHEERLKSRRDGNELANKIFLYLYRLKRPKGVLGVAKNIYQYTAAFLFVRCIEKTLRKKYSDHNFLYLDSFGEWAISHQTRLYLELFSYAYEQSAKKQRKQTLVKTLVKALGSFINYAAEILIVSEKISRAINAIPKCSYWYVGFHDGDIALRVQFLSVLKEKLGRNMGLVFLEDKTIMLGKHEVATDSSFQDIVAGTESLALEKIPTAHWLAKWMGLCASHKLRETIAKYIHDQSLLSEYEAKRLVSLLVQKNAGYIVEYHGIASVMKCLRPECIMASSMIGAGYHVREWAMRNHVKYVQYPHGVCVDLDSETLWSGDAIVTHGDYEKKYREAQHQTNGEIIAGGSFLHMQMNVDAFRWSKSCRSDQYACYLLSAESMYYPDMFSEFAKDVLNIGIILQRCGLKLLLRGHPRVDSDGLLIGVKEYCLQNGVEIMLSCGQSALTADLASCDFVMTRCWSGAVLHALYYSVPTVVWMPRNLAPLSENKILTELPLVVGSAQKLGSIIASLKREENIHNIIKSQESFLAQYVYQPRGDPHQRAKTIVGEIMKRRNV